MIYVENPSFTHTFSLSPPTHLSLSLSDRTHMQDLKDFTQDVHYENFRKKKLLEGSPAASGYAMGPGMEASPANAQVLEGQVSHMIHHMTYM